MNIHVNIERLVLDGIDITQREQPLLKTAMETELTRLLTEGGLPIALQNNSDRLHPLTAPIQIVNGGDPVRMGTQIAQVVYGGVRK